MYPMPREMKYLIGLERDSLFRSRNFNSLEVKVFLLTVILNQILYRHTKFISNVHSDNFHTSPKVSFHMNKPDYDIN